MEKFKLENTRQHQIVLSMRQDKTGQIIPVKIPPARNTDKPGTTTPGTVIVDKDMFDAVSKHLVTKAYFKLGWLKYEPADEDAVADHDALTVDEANDENRLNIDPDAAVAEAEAAAAAAKLAKDQSETAQTNAATAQQRADEVTAAANKTGKKKKTDLAPGTGGDNLSQTPAEESQTNAGGAAS